MQEIAHQYERQHPQIPQDRRLQREPEAEGPEASARRDALPAEQRRETHCESRHYAEGDPERPPEPPSPDQQARQHDFGPRHGNDEAVRPRRADRPVENRSGQVHGALAVDQLSDTGHGEEERQESPHAP